ncbi:pyridoxamine 5'-phosphate oxidase family protein [Nonomuraea aurantiaca]|uniref:pyridoxamine 5'-phosphate oxidase family protein n=1 Tax=Nonomuraea aurantiaca TaxID=2878562 RepID=UPI001CD95726|nr:pyridoxamine 5'-phosphate oxidase family protein [Nonomuraea aurantiaca]MCA2230052.1 pyridoxamine 5'-phosphate oxidase family protein [Nonomuraea aurantiaca]
MANHVTSFAEIKDQFDTYIGDIVYATMTTVDQEGRPRAQVLIPVWESVDGLPLGWLATYKTPVKAAHLAGNPHSTFSYWTPKQNAVSIDTVATWADDLETKRHVWASTGIRARRGPATTWATSGATRSCTCCGWNRGACR